jgi:ElaB/YqjD/DUF883 family membrane-anchored ribosome-binding protein
MTLFSPLFRRGFLAVGAALILGTAAIGIAAAQAQPATPTGQQQPSAYQNFVDALAKRLNISSANLETAISQARTDAGLPAGKGFAGRGGEGHSGFRVGLDAAATAIGITPDQLRTELPGKSLAQVAQAHGKTGADVAAALKTAAHQRIDQAVTANRLTQDQANTQKTQMDQRIDQLVNQVGPTGPKAGGPDGHRMFGRGMDLNAAATAIGISPDQLRTELPGKSLAQVAQAHGKTGADVAAALKAAAHQRIDQAVTANRLTQDQANTQKTNVDQRIDQLVNQVGPQRPAGAFQDETF